MENNTRYEAHYVLTAAAGRGWDGAVVIRLPSGEVTPEAVAIVREAIDRDYGLDEGDVVTIVRIKAL